MAVAADPTMVVLNEDQFQESIDTYSDIKTHYDLALCSRSDAADADGAEIICTECGKGGFEGFYTVAAHAPK